jgi:hypothetical protein
MDFFFLGGGNMPGSIEIIDLFVAALLGILMHHKKRSVQKSNAHERGTLNLKLCFVRIPIFPFLEGSDISP